MVSSQNGNTRDGVGLALPSRLPRQVFPCGTPRPSRPFFFSGVFILLFDRTDFESSTSSYKDLCRTWLHERLGPEKANLPQREDQMLIVPNEVRPALPKARLRGPSRDHCIQFARVLEGITRQAREVHKPVDSRLSLLGPVTLASKGGMENLRAGLVQHQIGPALA